MKENAKKTIEIWYSIPAELLERDLNTLMLFEPMTQDERDELIEVGRAMLAAKTAIEPPKPKRGRPAGSKNRKEPNGNDAYVDKFIAESMKTRKEATSGE